MKIAVFPGSFDPYTVGHESIVERALPLFDTIIISIGYNEKKQTSFFPLNKRLEAISNLYKNNPKIIVKSYQGLTINFARENNAKYLLRGLRNLTDMEYEESIAQMNKEFYKDIETIFMLCLPQHAHVSSSIIREVLRYKGDVQKFVPQAVRNTLKF